MESLKKKFFEKAQPVQETVRKLRKEHGDVELGTVTIEKVLSGMKGVVSLLTLTSKLDPVKGISFKGYSIPDLKEKLPSLKPDDEPLPEGLFYLMLIGELPSEQDVKDLSSEWSFRSHVPLHVFDVINSFPKNTHPMTQFSAAILAMSTDSRFRQAYEKGMHKKDYWDASYEGVMDLIARLPRIAAYIYRRTYHNDDHIEWNPHLDWAGNFAHMMGYNNDEVQRLFRLYLTIHSDHEGGNVSAHTTHLVGSALSSPYLALSAGMNGLAGPLHGLANQEVVKWIKAMLDELGTQEPTKEQLEKYVEDTLQSGKVVPGYGHAVLRAPDPRFIVQREFALKYFPDDPFFNVVNNLFEVVPPILGSIAKIKNPWPNVDAISGSLLQHYGIKEYAFYTVLFGVSRALGVLASLIWDRALGLPIERPKSQNIAFFKDKAGLELTESEKKELL
jgi:citrate synthase